MRDLSERRFGRQVAIKPMGRNQYRNVLWLCKCDCGNEHVVASGKLVQGKAKRLSKTKAGYSLPGA